MDFSEDSATADIGIVIIILCKIQTDIYYKYCSQIYFPGIIHVVYVLRPSGLFQKAISEVSSKFSSKDEYRFRLIVCSALSDLHEFIDTSQLTVDMGGSLIYSHHEWIQQRIVGFEARKISNSI